MRDTVRTDRWAQRVCALSVQRASARHYIANRLRADLVDFSSGADSPEMRVGYRDEWMEYNKKSTDGVHVPGYVDAIYQCFVPKQYRDV